MLLVLYCHTNKGRVHVYIKLCLSFQTHIISSSYVVKQIKMSTL